MTSSLKSKNCKTFQLTKEDAKEQDVDFSENNIFSKSLQTKDKMTCI